MIKTATKDLSAGMVTAEPVYSKTGQLLFPANTILTSQQITYLEFYGVESIKIIPEQDINDASLDFCVGSRAGNLCPESKEKPEIP